MSREIVRATGAQSDGLEGACAARWGVDRSFYRPQSYLARDGDVVVGAALVTGRPATRYSKIVELVADDAEVRTELIEAIVADATARGDVVVKWELWDETQASYAAEAGFVPLAAPHADRDQPDAPAGAARWLVEWPHLERQWYRQTTEFTCGAVSLLLGAPVVGALGFHPEDVEANRRTEMDLWRLGTNFPACEPVGLGVAARKTLPDEVEVEVHLDTADPVLLEIFGPGDPAADLRAELQRESRAEAAETGVAISGDRVAIEEVASWAADGRAVLLLVGLNAMHGDPEPHWILAHSAREGVVLIEDPWISREHGETWLDGHELPIALPELDAMVAYGEAGYRGVVVLHRRA